MTISVSERLEGRLAALAPGRPPLGVACSLGGCGIPAMSVARDLVLPWYRGDAGASWCRCSSALYDRAGTTFRRPVEHIATGNKFVNSSGVA
jgi:hypothetical protein